MRNKEEPVDFQWNGGEKWRRLLFFKDDETTREKKKPETRPKRSSDGTANQFFGNALTFFFFIRWELESSWRRSRVHLHRWRHCWRIFFFIQKEKAVNKKQFFFFAKKNQWKTGELFFCLKKEPAKGDGGLDLILKKKKWWIFFLTNDINDAAGRPFFVAIVKKKQKKKEIGAVSLQSPVPQILRKVKSRKICQFFWGGCCWGFTSLHVGFRKPNENELQVFLPFLFFFFLCNLFFS